MIKGWKNSPEWVRIHEERMRQHAIRRDQLRQMEIAEAMMRNADQRPGAIEVRRQRPEANGYQWV